MHLTVKLALGYVVGCSAVGAYKMGRSEYKYRLTEHEHKIVFRSNPYRQKRNRDNGKNLLQEKNTYFSDVTIPTARAVGYGAILAPLYYSAVNAEYTCRILKYQYKKHFSSKKSP